jgi:hypothetical protein
MHVVPNQNPESFAASQDKKDKKDKKSKKDKKDKKSKEPDFDDFGGDDKGLSAHEKKVRSDKMLKKLRNNISGKKSPREPKPDSPRTKAIKESKKDKVR